MKIFWSNMAQYLFSNKNILYLIFSLHNRKGLGSLNGMLEEAVKNCIM